MTSSEPSATDPSLPGTPLPEVSRVPHHIEPKNPRWIAPLALVVSLLAAVAAGWALLKPAPDPAEASAVSDPKAQVCGVFDTVSRAVSIQTKRAPGPDLGPVTPVATEAIAANARLSMSGGASYLLSELPSNTPKELADEVRSFAGELNGIAINALAGIPNDQEPQAGLLRSAEETNKKIVELCKE
ncbi:MAG: hypothetical protein KDB50_10065 [Mycobacterium sp.]|nr:hypothetical protein [Mycobacterium sp.]